MTISVISFVGSWHAIDDIPPRPYTFWVDVALSTNMQTWGCQSYII